MIVASLKTASEEDTHGLGCYSFGKEVSNDDDLVIRLKYWVLRQKENTTYGIGLLQDLGGQRCLDGSSDHGLGVLMSMMMWRERMAPSGLAPPWPPLAFDLPISFQRLRD